jgi:nitric oxide reductase activation protein
LKDVRIYVDAFRRKFERFLAKGGRGLAIFLCHRQADRLQKNSKGGAHKERGKFFMRREVPQEKRLAFKLLIDLSSSMKRENKAINALRALLLFCETLNALNMPFLHIRL